MRGRQALAVIPYAGFLGVRLEEDGEGIVCVLPFRDDLVGNAALPALHGGVVGAFLELTALVQAIELADSDRVPKPINFSVDYLRSATHRFGASARSAGAPDIRAGSCRPRRPQAAPDRPARR